MPFILCHYENWFLPCYLLVVVWFSTNLVVLSDQKGSAPPQGSLNFASFNLKFCAKSHLTLYRYCMCEYLVQWYSVVHAAFVLEGNDVSLINCCYQLLSRCLGYTIVLVVLMVCFVVDSFLVGNGCRSTGQLWCGV
jgi:hypothetical protein